MRMAGRGGRGRGRGLSFNVEALGFGHGEALPPPSLQPPPLFPPLESKPVPLLADEQQNYLLALKQELRGTLRDSGFYVQPAVLKKDVERYSDKHGTPASVPMKWDWNLFNDELKPRPVKRRCKLKPILPVSKKMLTMHGGDMENKLKELEAVEHPSSDDDQSEEKKEEGEDEGAVEDEELYDEEEQEEGTDYAFNYFDNGEGYLDDDDDNLDDGPVY